MDFFEAVKARASYRGKYTGESVSREDLQKIMGAGLAAPSGCNLQTTHLVGIDDKSVIKAVDDAVGKTNFAGAPDGIVVFTTPTPAYHNNLYNIQDYSAAIENMLLAASALGYASCWVEGYVTDNQKVAEKIGEILGAPEGWHAVAYLPIGKPAEDIFRAKKKPFEERAGFNKF